ncbi:MAG: GAF domain-containing protein [Chloroflexi bacterium CFX4]|nr:GAF domain-containing protein [Chloroflexi bacterium CFX4]MDL1921356.1 GAF domain-containing sensor histidine kinase [Chloroflexi bacterium CFX3]
MSLDFSHCAVVCYARLSVTGKNDPLTEISDAFMPNLQHSRNTRSGGENPRADRSEEKLHALSEAVRAITAEFTLERILKRLAEIAARMVGARYAAFGVPDSMQGLSQFLVYGMSEEEIAQVDHPPEGHGLLGVLLNSEHPIRLPRLQDHPQSVGFPEHHPHMTRFLGVPIVSKGQVLGSLYLCDRLDGLPFNEDDERMISLLAAHAAIAIENATLSDQLRRLAVLEERDRISMELHDGIIQSIYAIGIKLELMRLSVPEQSAQIAAVNSDLNRVIEDLRRYIRDLRVGVELSLTLREQMNELATRFREVSSARLVMDISSVTHLNEDRLHALLQITRESLSNTVRHANASEVYVDLHETPTHITLVISDNGKGFDPKSVPPGIGLRNIRQRARQLDGSVEIASRAGRGSTITVMLPIPASHT